MYKSRGRGRGRKRSRGGAGQGTEAAPATKDFLVVKGVIEENLPATSFRVKLENGHAILCHLSGKLRKNRIRLTPGDEVQIEISPYDLTKGRITYRF